MGEQYKRRHLSTKTRLNKSNMNMFCTFLASTALASSCFLVASEPVDDGVFYEMDGIRMRVTIPDTADSNNPSVRCDIENSNSGSIILLLPRTETGGFWLELTDSRGDKVQPLADWAKRNDPMDVNMSFIGRKFAPGERFSHTMNLATAFGEDWIRGRSLRVSWYFMRRPADAEGSGGGPLWGSIKITPLLPPGTTGSDPEPDRRGGPGTIVPIQPAGKNHADNKRTSVPTETHNDHILKWLGYGCGILLLLLAFAYWRRQRSGKDGGQA
jgi:hypothetical protein